MEFSLFLESNGKPLSGFKAEKEHNETRLVEITASVLEKELSVRSYLMVRGDKRAKTRK